jgi:hypothetical protein
MKINIPEFHRELNTGHTGIESTTYNVTIDKTYKVFTENCVL